jgi:hypothetical protein
MRKIRDALRLTQAMGMSRRLVGEATGIGKTAVGEYVRRALVVVMNDSAAPAAARVSAANALLDRGHGKPRQALEHGGTDGGPIQIVYLDAIDARA